MRALFIGRFQPFHKGHLEVVREIARGFTPVIVIGSAEVSHTQADPFTAGERYLMIRESLRDGGVREYDIVPVMNVNRYAVWVAHIVSLVPPFGTVVTSNPLTARLFREQGFEVRTPAPYSRAVFRGTHIRNLMRHGGPWEELVPPAVSRIIGELGGVERVRELTGSDRTDGGRGGDGGEA